MNLPAFNYGEENARDQTLVWKAEDCATESHVVLSGVIEGDEAHAWPTCPPSIGLVPDPATQADDADHALDVLDVDGLDVTNVVCNQPSGRDREGRVSDMNWVFEEEERSTRRARKIE